MDWLQDHEKELHAVFQECRSMISGFPEPMRSQGLAYLEQFDVFQAHSKKNYICYLLPFWFRSGCGLGTRETHRMSAGNVVLMLFFFLQDDLMDNKDSSPAELLPLANLLYVEFLNLYLPLFPPESPFWTFFRRYITEWADSVAGENAGDYYWNDRSRIARKASPLKLSSTASLLLSDQQSLIADSEDMLEAVLITLQMLDDYEDWEEDLTEGSYNCLLSLARHQLQREAAVLTSDDVKDFIFTQGGLALYTETATRNHERLLSAQLDIPGLTAFHQMLLDNLRQIAAAVEAEKALLQRGGLQYWISKHINL